MTAHRLTGIFGGTFDPVHYGHLRAAGEAIERLSLRDLRLLPAGKPPHRSTTFASAEHRLAMLELAVSPYDDLWVDEREVRRRGDSYMVDTLREIKREQPGDSLLLLAGQDSINTLDAWHSWRQLFELAHLVVLRRPESGPRYSSALFEELQPRLISDERLLCQSAAGLVLPLEVSQLAISSTHIRHQIATGKSPRFLLPDLVIEYIYDHRLYVDMLPIDV